MPLPPRLAAFLTIPLCLFITGNLPAEPPAPANPQPALSPPTDQQVTTAMEKAADFLLAAKHDDNWETPGKEWPNPGDVGAQTALILRALLDAGNNFQNEPVYHSNLFFRSETLAPAVAWLTQNAPPDDYVAALQASTFARFTSITPNMSHPLDAIKDCRAACLLKLINARDPQGNLPPSTTAETTVAAAALAYRLEFPNAYWQTTEKFWRDSQLKDGSWTDNPPGLGLRRDVVGIEGFAALLAARSYNDNELHLTPKPDPNVDLALHYLDTHPNLPQDPRHLFALERVAQATGRKSFGNTRWFPEGVATLLRTQNPDGSWTGKLPTPIETAYALLFLANGRTPLLFNKLQYDGAGGEWNARPNDAAYLTHWLSIRLCDVPLQSQTVSLADPVESWLDAPLLLITGSQDPKFTPQDIAKFREFINAGGIIFSNSNGPAPAFDAAMKKYALEATDHKFPFRQLPHNHYLFDKELGADVPHPPPLEGISNGIRELWIHSTSDIAADWQMRKYGTKSSFEFGVALYIYAPGMIPARSNLDPLTITPSPIPTTRTINLARIDYPGNPDPEPGAWPRMAQLAQRDFKTNLQLHTVKFADLDPKKYPIAHLTGTAAVNFTVADSQNLKAYLDHGGLIFIDSAAGNAPFADCCLALIKALYPDQSLQPLPADHPIYTGTLPDGQKLDTETSHDFFRKFGDLQLHHRVKSPDISAIIVAGKTKIIFSPWDITSGLLGTNTWGILGYAPPAAQTLARNILLYSQNPLAPPTP